MARHKKYDVSDELFLQNIERLAGLGFIDTEIAGILNICEKTLNTYKKSPKFLQSLKNGKDKADEKVLSALYENATGSGIITLKKQKVLANGTVVNYIEQVYVKPDTMAQIYWLNNRRKQDWRQNNQDSTGLTDNEILELRKLAKEEMVNQI